MWNFITVQLFGFRRCVVTIFYLALEMYCKVSSIWISMWTRIGSERVDWKLTWSGLEVHLHFISSLLADSTGWTSDGISPQWSSMARRSINFKLRAQCEPKVGVEWKRKAKSHLLQAFFDTSLTDFEKHDANTHSISELSGLGSEPCQDLVRTKTKCQETMWHRDNGAWKTQTHFFTNFQ